MDLLSMGDERFVSLTTFRRTGVGVPTVIWIARDGDRLVAITPAGTGKVKRLRHTPHVELRPASRRGAVADDAPVATAHAVVDSDPATVAAAKRVIAAKYGLEYRLFMVIERLARRGPTQRLAIILTPEPDKSVHDQPEQA